MMACFVNMVRWLQYDTRWPAFQELIDAGKRVLFMSGADYLTSGQELLFVKETICNWQEPSLPLAPFPACVFNVSQLGPSDDNFTIFRPETSEIEYGFLNSDGQIGSNKNLLDETSLPGMVDCGVNLPSPDNITPKRMESTVWVVPKGHELDPTQCVALLREAKTWQSVDCQAANMVPACVDLENPHYWQLGGTPVVEADAPSACAKLSPTDMEFSVPASGYENELVHRLLLEKAPASVAGVWLDAKALVSKVYSTEPEMTEEPEKKLYPIESVVSLE
ncbi:hypothetical protein BBJ28_00024461 [Nothophytophthora sp. Chile5]|nr:hypothetical protein BBJ28_00024461 [Nothophytophthora sp. Chile5]